MENKSSNNDVENSEKSLKQKKAEAKKKTEENVSVSSASKQSKNEAVNKSTPNNKESKSSVAKSTGSGKKAKNSSDKNTSSSSKKTDNTKSDKKEKTSTGKTKKPVTNKEKQSKKETTKNTDIKDNSTNKQEKKASKGKHKGKHTASAVAETEALRGSAAAGAVAAGTTATAGSAPAANATETTKNANANTNNDAKADDTSVKKPDNPKEDSSSVAEEISAESTASESNNSENVATQSGVKVSSSSGDASATATASFLSSATEPMSSFADAPNPENTEPMQPVDAAKEQKKAEILGKHEQRMEQMKQEKEEKEKKAKRNKILAVCIGAVAAVYVIGAVLFSFITYPNTYLADNDLSFKTESALQSALEHVSDKYTLTVTGLGMNLEISGESIDYDFDAKNVKNQIWEKKNPLLWPVEIFWHHSFKDDYVVNFNPEKLAAIVGPAVEGHNATAIAPQNAGFNINVAAKTATIKPEVYGTTLDGQKTYSAIEACVGSSTQSLELTSDQQIVPVVFSEDKRMESALAQANKMLQTTMNLTMGNTNVSTLAATTFGPWIEVSPEYKAILNQLSLLNWSAQLASECNTAGSTRTFTTPYGKQVSVEGSIGWEIDEPALAATINENIYAGTTVAVAVPCSSSLENYGGKGGKDWGNRYIDVDISSQTVRMYDESGNQIFSAECVTGKPATPTPTGLFTVYSKASPTVLHADDGSYHTPVQYWMPFSGGCGFHDATWQSAFGGNRWQTGYGSHGCVNLSYDAAGQLYSLCKTGDIVVVHN